MYPDAFGLRPRIEEMAGRLADAGYRVLAPNVFHRDGRAPLVDLGGLAEPAQRGLIFARIKPLMDAQTPDLVRRDALGYLAFLGGRIGVVGYCMGSAMALRTAAVGGDRVAAVAGFHPGNLITDSPDSPHLLARAITAEVYLGHADRDPSNTPDQQLQIARAFDAAGVPYLGELYAGAHHGFTMSDTAAFDAAAEARHWDRLLALFERTLR